MMKYLRKLLIIIFFFPVMASGQEPGAGLDYQMTMISNPALTGSEGDYILRLSYLNNFPGNNYNLHSIALSCDGYFPSLHGGAGLFLSDDYLGGILNDLKGGFSYSYYFQAGNKLYISAGLSASFYHRGYNFGSVVLPDQIDPLGGVAYPSGEVLSDKGRTIFDLATGFLFMTGRSFAGISVSHLAEPDISNTEVTEMKLKRQLLLHFGADLDLGAEKNLNLRPLGKLEIAKGLLSAGAGAEFGNKYLAVSSVFLADKSKNLDVQTGFSIATGRLTIFYNYRFNLVSGDNVLPFPLFHHTGISLNLNNVDKRKTIKTINFPKL
jgi:type IX secretion system PorP/SprF family membrane protein